MSFDCPKCLSANTSRVHIEHARGIKTTLTAGLATDGDGIGIGMGLGTTQTSLSSMSRPPEPRMISDGSVALYFISVTCFLGGVVALAETGEPVPVLAALALAAGALTMGLRESAKAKRDRHFMAHEYPKLRDAWERMMFCGRCGFRWIPAE